MSNTDQFCEYANEAVLSASYAKTNEAEQGLLEFEHLPHSADSSPVIKVDGQKSRTVESCERELIGRRRTEIQLRDALAREQALLHQKDELIRQMVVLRQEFRSSTVERRANDREPAFAARPRVEEC